MEILTAATPEEAAPIAADVIATAAARAIDARGKFTFALSGGSTPWMMLGRLAGYDLPWHKVHVFQVDERAAPDGDPARNLTHIQTQFLDRVAIPVSNVHAMPVTVNKLETGAKSHAQEMQALAGDPPVLDLVHLGLGSDGHTASLVPGDDVLDRLDSDVAVSASYQGHERMTLTFPAINRARQILWLVTGADKAPVLERLLRADPSIPAGRISQGQAVVVTDIWTAERKSFTGN